MKRVLAALVIAMTVGLPSVPANADLLTGYAQLQLGGAVGSGLSGELKGQSFYARAQGFTYGMIVGAEILLLDLWIAHDQFVGATGLTGTWTKLMAGLDTQIGLGRRRGAEVDEQGFYRGGLHEFYLGVGGGFGAGFGTLKQVKPPLNNRQIDDKGAVAQLSVSFGYRINPYLSVAAELPMEFAAMIKNGAVNDSDNFYTAMRISMLISINAHFIVK